MSKGAHASLDQATCDTLSFPTKGALSWAAEGWAPVRLWPRPAVHPLTVHSWEGTGPASGAVLVGPAVWAASWGACGMVLGAVPAHGGRELGLQPAQRVPPEGSLFLACPSGKVISGWGLGSSQGQGLGLNHERPRQAVPRAL